MKRISAGTMRWEFNAKAQWRKGAKLGHGNLGDDTSNLHPSNSASLFACCFVRLLWVFAPLRLCVKNLPHGFGLVLLLLLASLGNVCGGTTTTQITAVACTAVGAGTEQRYVLMLPAEFKPEQPHDLLIALPGLGSNRWQFVRDPRDECRAARDVAATSGTIYVAPDYRAQIPQICAG